ncbi:alkaline phosphatase [Edaphobacillus lindanitolerans]|uniref:Alkaline phosphatase n=1 Tax=Edaphobacillus lindanitolerans TaxID=550447 RepID=A0A1U7PS36_9BACI|nr:alkaline phosphatase [Edaphobacillus lindanitolerans]SIT88544.1 alkaline phosphatase [Edaphobacillus lindanitolerans]
MKGDAMKKILPVALAAAVIAGVTGVAVTSGKSKETGQEEVKNVIFLIGDGMGTSYLSAYRSMKDDPKTKKMEPTEFDPYLIGQQMTYPDDPKESITDSAAAATAMSSGVKTYNNAIAVDNDKSEVKTILEAAKEKGKSTGLVATSEITHATPASFGAHDPSRKNMEAIADDYYDELIGGEHKVDVLLGGGLDLLKREDRDLTKEFEQDGYTYVTDRKGMLDHKKGKLLGLFAPGGMPKMIDREDSIPSLEEMTRTAIKTLQKNKDGFFLMVEGSQIDWAGHDNDIVGSMSEMEDFEKAFRAAVEFAEQDGQTLVIATADHSTGGLSVGANDEYRWSGEPLKAAKRTPDFMAAEIAGGADAAKVLKQYVDLPLTKDEVGSVRQAAAGGDATAIDDAIERIFDERSGTGWTTGGHTGEDVPVYAYGPQSSRFSGLLDNTDHARILFELLKTDVTIKDR